MHSITHGPRSQAPTLAEILEAQRLYYDAGIYTVPIEGDTKNPGYSGWQKSRFTPEQARRDGVWSRAGVAGIGMLNGEPSGGILDVDLDHLMAVRIGKIVFTKYAGETLTMGRPSKPESHLVYRCTEPSGGRRSLKLRKEVEPDEDKNTILELRGNQHTVIAPSIHESGERVEFAGGFDPSGISEARADQLLLAYRIVAGAVIIASEMPVSGRHDLALYLGGYLAHNGVDYNVAHDLIEAAWSLVRPKSLTDRHMDNALETLVGSLLNIAARASMVAEV